MRVERTMPAIKVLDATHNASAHLGHPGTQFLPGRAEPRVEIYHTRQLVHRQRPETHLASVHFYHWATLALNMSSTNFSIIS